jgi:uncharacterized protein
MVDTQVSEACSARCEGSSPSLGTISRESKMKKIFIIHGFEGSPNGGWRPWLMWELEIRDIYACALPMPTPENPICSEWMYEIERQVIQNKDDEIYLIGHSLWGPAILRFLEKTNAMNISGSVLVSSPSEKNNNQKLNNFFDSPFDFEKIKLSCKKFVVIHGGNDSLVPVDNAQFLAKELGSELKIIPEGGHLNGSAGWFSLPECLESLLTMF